MLTLPPGVVRISVASPSAPAGGTKVTLLSETTVKLLTGLPPMVIEVVPVRPVPVRVCVPPPVMVAKPGEIPRSLAPGVIVGPARTVWLIVVDPGLCEASPL